MAASVKWLIYAALAIAAVVLLVRHWSRFIEMLARFWADLLAAFGRKRGDERDRSAEPEAPLTAVVHFAAFENPFFSGAAGRMPPAQLVRYTFECSKRGPASASSPVHPNKRRWNSPRSWDAAIPRWRKT